MLMDSCSKSLIGSGTHKCTVNVRTQKRAAYVRRGNENVLNAFPLMERDTKAAKLMFDADMRRLSAIPSLQRGRIDLWSNSLSSCEAQNLSHAFFFL